MQEQFLSFTPIVHMNGSGRDALEKSVESQREAVRQLRAAFSDGTFHSRDYYVVPGQWERARKERLKMLNHLKMIEDYIEAHENAISMY